MHVLYKPHNQCCNAVCSYLIRLFIIHATTIFQNEDLCMLCCNVLTIQPILLHVPGINIELHGILSANLSVISPAVSV